MCHVCIFAPARGLKCHTVLMPHQCSIKRLFAKPFAKCVVWSACSVFYRVYTELGRTCWISSLLTQCAMATSVCGYDVNNNKPLWFDDNKAMRFAQTSSISSDVNLPKASSANNCITLAIFFPMGS